MATKTPEKRPEIAGSALPGVVGVRVDWRNYFCANCRRLFAVGELRLSGLDGPDGPRAVGVAASDAAPPPPPERERATWSTCEDFARANRLNIGHVRKLAKAWSARGLARKRRVPGRKSVWMIRADARAEDGTGRGAAYCPACGARGLAELPKGGGQ